MNNCHILGREKLLKTKISGSLLSLLPIETSFFYKIAVVQDKLIKLHIYKNMSILYL